MFSLIALAHGADDDALRKLLSARAKAEIPAELFCVERPELPEPFGPVAAVGIQVKGVGCRLKAVAVGDELVDPLKGLPKAVGSEAWAKLGSEERKAAAGRWTLDVLLAFDQPLPADQVAFTPAGKGWTVAHTFDQRVPGANTSARTPGTWTYDEQGLVTAATRDGGTRYATRLYTKLLDIRGVSEADVSAAMTARGGQFHDCVRAAWSADLALEDRVKVGWDIAGGKATNITGKGDSPPELLQCYANSVARLEFPPTMAGHVEWQFAVLRVEEPN